MTRADGDVLQGSGFVLRRARFGDGQFLLALSRDPEIHRMFGGSSGDLTPYTDDDARHWAERLVAHACAWVIDIGGVIGEVRLDRIDKQDRRGSLAIGIFDPAWLAARASARQRRGSCSTSRSASSVSIVSVFACSP